MSYTEGKWKVGDISFTGNPVIMDEEGNIVAEAETKDWAQYIVKAVNSHRAMYEALTYATREWELTEGDCLRHDTDEGVRTHFKHWQEVKEELNAVLRQAEGRE